MAIHDRRAARRVQVTRDAIIEPLQARAIRRPAQVLDLSRTGARLAHDQPLEPGTRLRVEAQPSAQREDSAPIESNARVIRTMRIRDGHELGIKFEPPLVSIPPVRVQSRKRIEPHAIELTSAPLVRNVAAPNRSKRGTRILAALLLLLVLVLLLLIPRDARTAYAGSSTIANQTKEPARPLPKLSNPIETGARVITETSRKRADTRSSYVQMMPLARQKRFPAGETTFVRPEAAVTPVAVPPLPLHADPSAGATDTSGAQLDEHGDSNWPTEEPGPAISALPELHPAAIRAEVILPASSAPDEPSRFAQPGSIVRASFERITEPQLDLPISRFHAFADVPHALLIDLSDRSLSILQYGEPVRNLDVTIGANDTTPTGDFSIVTKLLDPDWYNRGRPVKAGDPSNPLGRHWLGLADSAGNRLPIGIHATTDVASIGQSASRGCVRLSVRDAEAVFRLSPIGTPVHICR